MRWAKLAIAAVSVSMLAGACFAATPPRDGQREGTLKVGDLAPDFDLKPLDGKATVKLSSFRGQKPVALVFGSYT